MAPDQHTTASPSEDKTTPNGARQPPIRILHLEDQPSDALFIRLAIEQAEDPLPVSIQLVRDRTNYLAALHARCSDLILCDYRLPGYDGEEALKAARDLCPEVPVIMVTGEMGEERAIETLKAGATDYVLKDGLKRLVPSIQRALREAQLERERRESEEKYRAVAENSPDGIFISQGGVVRYANQTAARMLGRSSTAEVVGLPIFNIFHPDFHAVIRERIKDLTATGKAQPPREEKIVRADGSTLDVETTAAPITLGGRFAVHVEMRDITERKQAEAAHRQTQSIIDNTPAIVYAFDLEEGFLLVNAALAALLKSTPEAMIGKRRHEFMPKEDADWHEANDRQVIKAGRAVEFEEYSQLHGRSITWLTTKFPLWDAQGKIYAVAGISSDISARKRTERALRESEQKYRDVVTYSRDVIYRYNIQTNVYEFVSEAAEEVTGYSAEEFKGLTREQAVHMIHPEDLQAFHAGIRELEERGEADVEYRQQVKSGAYRWLSNRMTLVRDGEGRPLYRIGNLRDITQRKTAEVALKESEARFRAMADFTPVMIWVTDPHGQVQMVNRASQEFFGITEPDVQGPAGWQPLVHPEEAPDYVGKFTEALEKKEHFRAEARVRYRTGQWRWVRSYGVPRFSATGEYLGMVGSSFDITDQKDHELLLRAHAENLRMLVDAASRPRVLVSAQGLIEAINGLAANVLGYRPDELEGRAAEDFVASVPPIVHDLYRDDMRKHAGKPLVTSIQLRRKDGQVQWVSIEVRPLSAGTNAEKYLVLLEPLEFEKPPEAAFGT